MLIGVDANEANVNKRVGSNVYAFEVLKQIYQQDKTNDYVIYLSQPPLADLPKTRKGWSYRVIPQAPFWTQWRLPLDLYFHLPRPKLFLTLGHYAPRFSPIPTVVCIMDLAFLKFPETFKSRDLWQLKSWTNYSVRKASKIIAISEATKKDVVASYGVSASRIIVAYPGVAKLPLKESSPVKENYLLYLGTLQPRKNLDALIEGFSLLTSVNSPRRSRQASPPRWHEVTPRRWKDLRLVIAGKTGWKYQPKKHPGVKYLGFVPQEQLGNLIAGAKVLVLPSLYEGFGIPVVAAMSLNTPVLVSRNSSLTEIVGDTGQYIEPPFDADAVRKGIIGALSQSRENQKDMLTKARQRANQFTWDKTGQKVMEVLNEF